MDLGARANVEEYDVVFLGGGTGGDGRCLDIGRSRETGRGDRAQIHRWLVPEHRLLAQQEHYSQRKGRLLCPEKR